MMSHLPHRLCVLLALAIVSPRPVAAAIPCQPPIEGEGMPEVVFAPFSTDYPVWVRADRVLDETGRVNRALFDNLSRSSIELYRQTEEAPPCVRLRGTLADYGYWVVGELIERVYEADAIVRGRVTGRAAGFSQHLPATLIRIEPQETLKGPHQVGPRYFAVDVADLLLGETRFYRTDEAYPRLPELGDEVLLLARLRDLDGRLVPDAEYLGVAPHDLFVANPGGALSLPGIHRPGETQALPPELPLQELLGWIEEALLDAPAPPPEPEPDPRLIRVPCG